MENVNVTIFILFIILKPITPTVELYVYNVYTPRAILNIKYHTVDDEISTFILFYFIIYLNENWVNREGKLFLIFN